MLLAVHSGAVLRNVAPCRTAAPPCAAAAAVSHAARRSAHLSGACFGALVAVLPRLLLCAHAHTNNLSPLTDALSL